MIIFVGDQPSKSMLPWAKPFEGALSEKRLKDWISILKPGNYVLLNSYTTHDKLKLVTFADSNDTFVALGNNASNVLTRLKIPHFKLPHPSGLNRQLNDLDFIVKKLDECKKYILNVKVNNN